MNWTTIILLSINSMLIIWIIHLNSKVKLQKMTIERDMEKMNSMSIEHDENERRIIKQLEESRQRGVINMYEANLSATSEMFSNIAHQWRQPLNTLILILANMEDAYKYNELEEEYFTSLIERSKTLINNMSKTIDDFRYLFKPIGEKELFSPYGVIKSLMLMVEENLIENDINILMSEDDKSIMAYGDKGQYSQAVMNVINNSIDAHSYNEAVLDKRIEVKIYQTEKETVCEIQDNAGGIPVELLNEIFNMYVTTKDSKEGTGIGLYITKNIIENALGGTVSCENNQNGLLTTIKIPKDGEVDTVG